MRRKRTTHTASHDRWLVSYADFITLLFAFFVVLYATGQSDKRKKQELAVSIQSAFAEMGIFDAHSNLRDLAQVKGSSGFAAPAFVTAQQPATPQESMAAIQRQLLQATEPEIKNGTISIRESEAGLVVSLEEAGFFESGDADVRPSSLAVLNRIAELLPQSPLRVEGHTDNVPIHTAQFASNWELSSSRASGIARLLLGHPNVHPEQMSVAGYAEFHPVASNATPEGRTRNRRVDIVLLTTQP